VWSSVFWVSRGLTTSQHEKKKVFYECYTGPWTWTDSLEEVGTWNVRILYKSCSLKTVASKSAKYKLHLVGLQDVG
jgi:hypothetical protein